MSETNDPFAAFKEGVPPAESSAGKPSTENKKKARKKAASKSRPANGGVDAAAPAAGSTIVESREARHGKKKTRKPRQKRELKLPLSTLLALGNLSAEESSVVQSMAIGFADFSKKSRGRIVSALAKIFA